VSESAIAWIEMKSERVLKSLEWTKEALRWRSWWPSGQRLEGLGDCSGPDWPVGGGGAVKRGACASCQSGVSFDGEGQLLGSGCRLGLVGSPAYGKRCGYALERARLVPAAAKRLHPAEVR